ncbi:MAG: thiosulfate oxidation carrier protein SoxY [Rhodospirillales bacterium]
MGEIEIAGNTIRLSELDRRGVLKAAGAGILALAGACLVRRGANATPEEAADLLGKLTGGAPAREGKVSLKLPEIAEDGAVVPITVTVDSPMTETDYVKAIHIIAEENPWPEVVTFNMTAGLGKAEISTRMRLAKTQNVVVAAVMSNGSVHTAKKRVKVTIGGCDV